MGMLGGPGMSWTKKNIAFAGEGRGEQGGYQTRSTGAGGAAAAFAPRRTEFKYGRHIRQILSIAGDVGARHLTLAAVAALRHRRALTAAAGAALFSSSFRRQIQETPQVWGMVRTGFISALWEPEQRFALAIDHCRVMSRLGPLFDFPSHHYVELMRLPQLGPGYRVTLNRYGWLIKTGQLSLTVWEGNQKVYYLSFSLASDGTAYVGGLQGEKTRGVEQFRAFKRVANDMRPRDLTIELFRMMCRAIGVERILAVSDATHCERRPVRGALPSDGFFSGYDEAWAERGGVVGDDGFFALPLMRSVRTPEQVPSRKRALYRRRDEMLGTMELELRSALAGGMVPGRLKKYSDPVG